MKFTTSVAALAFISSFAAAAPALERTFNDKYFTTCKEDTTPAFDETTYNKTIDTYTSAYGGGGGTLEHGVDGAPTYQGVCCEGWCLYVHHAFLPEDYHWNDLDFQSAVQRTREAGKGRGACSTDIQKHELRLNYMPNSDKIWIKTGKSKGRWIKLSSEMGDTCSGAKPYRGPVG